MSQTRSRRKATDAEPNTNGATPGQQDLEGGEVPADPVPPVQDILIAGPHPLDLFNAGGKKPNTGSVRFVGGKVGLEPGTAYRKGDTIRFQGTATVVDVSQRDKRDRQTRIVVECEQKHLAEIDDLTVTPLDAA